MLKKYLLNSGYLLGKKEAKRKELIGWSTYKSNASVLK